MEKINNLEPEKKQRSSEPSGRVWVGLIFIIVGSLLFAERSGLDLPYWIFSWKMVLIAVGLFIGARRSFRLGSWVIPVIIGCVFLTEDVFYDFNLSHYYGPIIIIGIGLALILRKPKHYRKIWSSSNEVTDDTINITSVLSGTKESVISKDFKGGEITSVLGGSEINFTQADIVTSATIDITNFMGGTKIIVPAHWSVKSDIVCILGGVDEKRTVKKDYADPSKILRLTGTCLMGGVEIKSY